MLLSLGEFLWSLLVIFFMVIYFMMLFYVIVDVFRRHDASGGKKAMWLLFLLIVPLIGLLAYVITNGDGMAARNVQEAQQQQEQFDSYVRTTAGVVRQPRSRRPRACLTPARSANRSSTDSKPRRSPRERDAIKPLHGPAQARGVFHDRKLSANPDRADPSLDSKPFHRKAQRDTKY
jgi:hypothetical protein